MMFVFLNFHPEVGIYIETSHHLFNYLLNVLFWVPVYGMYYVHSSAQYRYGRHDFTIVRQLTVYAVMELQTAAVSMMPKKK